MYFDWIKRLVKWKCISDLRLGEKFDEMIGRYGITIYFVKHIHYFFTKINALENVGLVLTNVKSGLNLCIE